MLKMIGFLITTLLQLIMEISKNDFLYLFEQNIRLGLVTLIALSSEMQLIELWISYTSWFRVTEKILIFEKFNLLEI